MSKLVPELSIVIPVLNEEKNIPLLLPMLKTICDDAKITFEVICCDDGSTDTTRQQLDIEHGKDQRVKYLSFSRNFGKEAAILAGFESSCGHAVIVMDADFQDPPELIPKLVNEWREGADIVHGVRSVRQDGFIKRCTAWCFYRVMNTFSDVPIIPNAGDFKLYSRAVVDALLAMSERNRFMKGLSAWVGFKSEVVYFERPTRREGKTKWSYFRLWNYSLEGLTSFSGSLIKVWTYIGFLTSFFAFCYALFLVVRVLLYGIDVPGYASLAVIMLFFNGVILMGMGLLGEYVSRIFIEVKGRPHYIVKKQKGLS